jgi:glucosyl-dolichyl phosphate glucuronosyltransferase
MIFSVIVCTYNRANMLADVLSDLARQEIPSKDYEVLVIDNGSTDQTALVAKRFCEHYTNFQCFCEVEVGLSHARNRGFQVAQGKYVGFTDDDCRIHPTWLAKAKVIALEIEPDIFGGPWLPFYTVQKPFWYQDKYDTYAAGNYPKVPGVQSEVFPSGANVFYRRDLLVSCGGFDPNLGMKGTVLGYEEETEAQKRILSRFPRAKVYFEPGLIVQHWVRPAKMHLFWKFKQQYAYGIAKAYSKSTIQPVARINSLVKLLWILISILGHFVLSLLQAFLRDRSAYPFIQNYFYEVTSRSLYELSYRVFRFRLSQKKQFL